MNLEQLQRAVFEVTRQPLTPAEKMRRQLPDGRSISVIANTLIKPNDRMTSFERLEIYNQQYWFRIMASLSEDFPGLRVVIGERKFRKLAIAYLNECPSESFTLRNLGARLESWLSAHPAYLAGAERLAVDMVRLEWAEIEAFDGLQLPRLAAEDFSNLGGDQVFRLQPHLYLLDLAYPVDKCLFRIRGLDAKSDTASNAVLKFPAQTHRARRPTLPRPGRVYLAVYRLQGTVYFKRLARDAFALLRALHQGKPLEEAIEVALLRRSRSLDRLRRQLQDWFHNWSYLGWFARP